MVGLFLGLLAGAFVAFIAYTLIDIKSLDYYGEKAEAAFDYAKIAVPILVIIAFVLGGVKIEKSMNGRYVDQYQAQKATIEASLQSDVLSGLERIQLVQQAAEANKELAGYQYDCRQWYGFAVDDRVLDLEPIDISGGAENAVD